MIQRQLDILQESGASILRQYTNGYIDSRLQGTDEEQEAYNHSLRVHYLWGALKSIYLSGTTPYIGDTEISGTDVEGIYNKLWHYNGVYSAADLSDYSAITADSGEGTGDTPTTTPVSSDHYRAGNLAVTSGAGTVTFSSPLDTADYELTVYIKTSSGYQQNNLGTIVKYKSGFTYDDALSAGTLHYFAVEQL